MTRLLCVALLATVVVSVPIALVSRQSHRCAEKPIWVLIGIDNSGSAKSQESAAVYQASTLVLRLNPDADHLTLYRVDHEVWEFFDGHPPISRDRLLGLMTQELRKPLPDPGTRPVLFWREIANRAATARGPVCIVFCSDGDNDDLSSQSRLVFRQAAVALARNPSVFRVVVVGARPCNWAGLRSDFAPLGDRFVLTVSAQPSADEIANIIDHVRNNHAEVHTVDNAAR